MGVRPRSIAPHRQSDLILLGQGKGWLQLPRRGLFASHPPVLGLVVIPQGESTLADCIIKPLTDRG